MAEEIRRVISRLCKFAVVPRAYLIPHWRFDLFRTRVGSTYSMSGNSPLVIGYCTLNFASRSFFDVLISGRIIRPVESSRFSDSRLLRAPTGRDSYLGDREILLSLRAESVGEPGGEPEKTVSVFSRNRCKANWRSLT